MSSLLRQLIPSEVRYSQNHNFLRSIGFLTLLAAAPGLRVLKQLSC